MRRRLIRRIPGAARRMFERRSQDYTAREWSEAVGVHVETMREHAKLRGLRCKPGAFRMHSFEEQRDREARVSALRCEIQKACAERPDAPPRRADLARMSETAKQQSPRLTHAAQVGGASVLRMARRRWA